MKEEIIEVLKQKSQISTSEIASRVNKNYYEVVKTLEELESEKIVVRILFRNFTYWKLNDEVKNGEKI